MSRLDAVSRSETTAMPSARLLRLTCLLAASVDVPVLEATDGACSLEEAHEFLALHPEGVMLKAVAGGGGRVTGH